MQGVAAMSKLLTVVLLFFGMVWSVASKADYPTEDWMSYLDGYKLITQITVPGTHDSATDYEHCKLNPACWVSYIYVSTQTYNIHDQLHKGIRFFDIRLAYEEGDLRLHHSLIYLEQNFANVVDVAQSFLSAYPSEFVIFLIKQEHTSVSADTFWARIHAQLDNYPTGLFYLTKSVPTVDMARGKIVIMARNYTSSYQQGYHVNWSDNTVHNERNDGDLRYVVEDHYSMTTVPVETKFAEVAQNLYLAELCATCGNPKTLYITFLSGTGVDTPPKDIAKYENPHLVGWLSDRPGPRPGIIIMDYAGDSSPDLEGDKLIQEVIKQNFY